MIAIVEGQKKCLAALIATVIMIYSMELSAAAQDTEPTALTLELEITELEIEMMVYVVAHEVGHCDKQSKRMVASTIVNRARDERFPDTIYGVLHDKGQYGAIVNFYYTSIEPDSESMEVVREILEGMDDRGGALAFYAPQYMTDQATADWFESLIFVSEHEGMRYFRW